jgi:hypothetical protein
LDRSESSCSDEEYEIYDDQEYYDDIDPNEDDEKYQRIYPEVIMKKTRMLNGLDEK